MYSKVFFALVLIVSVTGCADYAINVNEKNVYNPLGVFTDFQVTDRELQRCIDLTIKEEKLRSAGELKSLMCPDKSIQTLAGLELFTELRVLGLQGNALENTQALAALGKLEQLNLANTGLQSLANVSAIKHLHYLNLQGNPALNCKDLELLDLDQTAEILKPEHCGK